MKLMDQWKEMAYEPQSQEEYESFWSEYIPKEEKIYQHLLSHPNEALSGTISELAAKFEIEPVTFLGFIDGINTSLPEEIDLENLSEDSQVVIQPEMEKLYYNMLEAKADWLYNLPQWEEILSPEKREEITKLHKKSKTIIKEEQPGRNDPCPCGSGKKYKKCCGKESA